MKTISEFATKNHPDHAERLWMSMQYVLGELDEQAESQFEEQLQTDTALCECVVEAGRLVAELSISCQEYHTRMAGSSRPCESAAGSVSLRRVVSPVEHSVRRSVRRLNALVVAMAIAASLLVLLLPDLSPARRTVDVASGISRGGRTDDRQLSNEAVKAAAVELATSLLTLYSVDDESQLQSADPEREEPEESSDSGELLVPEWLIAAVELQHSHSETTPDRRDDASLPEDDLESDVF